MVRLLTYLAALCAAALAASLTTAAAAEHSGSIAPVWRAPVGTDGTASPVYSNGRLFVGTASGLVGLDPATGAIVINFHSGPVSTTPAVVRGFDWESERPANVIFGTRDGILHALSTAGEPLWTVELGAAPASPLVIEATAYPWIRLVVGAGGTLFALDGDGNRQWATALEGGDISKPAAALTTPDGTERVIVAAGNRLHALDAATGAVLWSVAPSPSPLGAPAVSDPNLVGDPTILVGDRAGTLFSLDPRTGAILATFPADAAIAGAPAFSDPAEYPWIFVADGGGHIYAFDQTDERPTPVWRATLGGPIDGSPVLANGVLYAATNPADGDGRLAALDAASGRPLFDALLPAGTAAAPLVTDGRLIVATGGGDVLAYEGPDS